MISIRILKVAALVLLFFNGIGAVYGGGNLILHPDGSSLGITIDYLKHSPFSDFMIPGIILFLVNGVLSLLIAVLTILNRPNYKNLIFAEGLLLSGWILIQMVLLRTVNFLHVTMGSVGILLLVIGFLLKSKKYIPVHSGSKSDK